MNGWLRRANWSAFCRPLWKPLVSGVLLALAFPDPAIFPLAWVALVPYLLFLLEDHRLSIIWAGHLLFSFLYLGLVLYWIPRVLAGYGGFGLIPSGLIFLALLALLSLYLLPFTLGTRWIAERSKRLALLAAPALWLICELLRTHFPAGGFPWGAVGYSQFPLKWLIQVSDLGGVYLVSFLVLWGNCAFVALFRLPQDARRIGATAASAFVLANIYGFYRSGLDPGDGPEIRVDLVQPMVLLSKDRDYYANVFFEEMADSYRRSAVDGADWVILPEAPNPFPYGRDFYYTNFWKKLALDYRVPILLSSVARDEGGKRYNSVFLIDGAEGEPFRYDKRKRVPFGEYLPYGRILGFAGPLVQQVGGFSAGGSDQPLGSLKGVPFGVLICYESIFPSLSRQLAGMGAQILVNVTNDHWFGETSAPTQHLQMAAFRSIETRRSILRAANSGYTAVIDPTGRIREKSDLNVKTVQRIAVRPASASTLFLFWGQGLNVLLIMINGLGLLVVALKTSSRKKEVIGGRL